MANHASSHGVPARVPARKVGAGGIGGAVATVVIWTLSEFTPFKPEPAVAAAMSTLITFAVAYLIPSSDEHAS